MKHLISILITLLICSAAVAQVQELEPTVSEFPNLHPDTLSKYQALADEYNRILEQGIPYESLSDKQKDIVDSEPAHSEGPYFTGEIGCSWYCAADPSSLTSSSQLESTKAISYKAENVHDFDLRTAWVEGQSDYGIGTEIKIEFELAEPLKVTHIDIFNGYCKSEKAWKENARVKVFSLFVNGKLFGRLHLGDTYKRQRFDLGNLGGNAQKELVFTLRVEEVYPGTKYKDTAISEINFDGTGDH